MLHTLCFSLQNAIYFIILSFLVPVLFTFYIQGVLKFKCKTPVPKVKSEDASEWNPEWGTEDPDWLSSALQKTCLHQVTAAYLHSLAKLLLKPSRYSAPIYCESRRMWPRGLRHGSASASLLELWDRIPSETWMSLSLMRVACCQV
jgi:hypothetical protein